MAEPSWWGTENRTVGGAKVGGGQLVEPPLVGDTTEPATVESFSGSRTGAPLVLRPFAQLAAKANLEVSRCPPVRRSSTQKQPSRSAGASSLRARPLKSQS